MNVIKPTMTMKQMQTILNKGGRITFLTGTYNITQTLYLVSGTDITCEADVIFQKKCLPSLFMTKVNSKTTKYNGVKQLSWVGGKIVSEIQDKTQSNLITLVHAKDIHISDLVTLNDYAQHCIEINACRDVIIKGCSFNNHKPPKAYKEAIQIDFSNFSGLTYADANDPTYDGTHCQNITVFDCSFGNVAHAIGTHTCSHENKAHKDIYISSNNYLAYQLDDGIFMKCLNMQNVFADHNYITNASIGFKLNATKTETLSHGGTVKVDYGKRNRNVIIDASNKVDLCKQYIEVV